jgi:hypothetical protein
MAGEDSSKSKTPKASKLPAKSLAEALTIAQALKDYAVPASKAVIAGQMKMSVSSSGLKSKFASAGYFGLIDRNGEKFELTTRGEAALDGDEVAKRTAVMSTGFGPIIDSLKTRPVNVSLIESRLTSDHAATPSGAKTSAAALVESAEEAGLIVDDKFDAEAIESVDRDEIGPKATDNGSGATPSKKAPSAQKKTSEVETPKPDPPKPDPPKPSTAGQTSIQVVVQVDGSKMEPAKIAELVKLLREPG